MEQEEKERWEQWQASVERRLRQLEVMFERTPTQGQTRLRTLFGHPLRDVEKLTEQK